MPATAPSAAASTVTLGARWLRTKTRWVAGSNRMPSGLPCTGIVLRVASVLASNITTGLLLVKPWADLGSTATPWTPLVSATSPAGASVSRS